MSQIMIKISIAALLVIFNSYSLQAKAQQFITSNDQAVSENIQYLKKNLKTATDHDILKIAKYLAYIKLDPTKNNYRSEVTRLLDSSLQFILCENREDIACLESKSNIDPSNWDMRLDSRPDLGKEIRAGKNLKIEYYFTQGWYNNFLDKETAYQVPTATVAMTLANKIKSNQVVDISMAMYGIDDLKETMASVFTAVKNKIAKNIPVRAVVDVTDSTIANSFLRDYDLIQSPDLNYKVINVSSAIDYSYIVPIEKKTWAFSQPEWLNSFLSSFESRTIGLKRPAAKLFLANEFLSFDHLFQGNQIAVFSDVLWLTQNLKSMNTNDTATRINFQYNGTMEFMRALNLKVTTNEEARAHVEYPAAGIMHNKFIVFENKNKQKSVWTGTANIAKTCMGSEENANLSIFINNDAVASAFQDEFDEMFNPFEDPNRPVTLVTGAFHNKKRANTNRFFSFDDGTQVRVHFSPTDDAEHRVILPMLYSARAGDKIRISMFGSSGYELVRAMQAASARGVDIKIAIDSLAGSGANSWIKSSDANLFEVNPFSEKPLGSIEIRKNMWPGLNHHKTATLTRRLKNKKYRPELIIVGSQNWSGSGNDINDENVVTISNKQKALDIMLAFNKEFDEKIWTTSEPVLAPPLNSTDQLLKSGNVPPVFGSN